MEVSPQEFRDVQTLVRRLCGLVLTDDKMYLVRTRLEPVVRAHGYSTFGEYLGHLQQLNAVVMRDELVEALATGETSFHRDGHPFEEFRRHLLPALAESLRQRRDNRFPVPMARLWSAGCSTGQEPYSIAMVVQDFLAAHPAYGLRPDQFPILATDVSARSLAVAREGRYLDRDLDRGLPAELRSRYFQKEGNYSTAKPELRRQIEFRRLNLIDRITNLGPFEVIFCRNVLIYFDTPTKQRLCEQFHQLLVPGGVLIVGAAETLYGVATPFSSDQLGSTIIYRR